VGGRGQDGGERPVWMSEFGGGKVVSQAGICEDLGGRENSENAAGMV